MFCANCGRAIERADGRCDDCGHDLAGSPPVDALATAGESAPGVQPTFYAGFWVRLAALIIDLVVMGVALWMLILALAAMRGDSLAAASQGSHPWLNLVIGVLYYALLESSPLQGTLGKHAVGIKVTDEHGERISVGRGFRRAAGRLLSMLLLVFGFFMVSFTKRRQGLHDKIANTRVVYRHCTPTDIEADPRAPRASAWSVIGAFFLTVGIPIFGIGLVFLMGFFASQSEPTAQDQVNALYQEAQSAMQAIIEQHEKTGTWPQSIAQTAYHNASPLVRNVAFDRANNTVTAFAREGAAFQLQWSADAKASAQPVCHSRDIPDRLMPAECLAVE